MQKQYYLPFTPCSNTSECVRIGNKGLAEIQVPMNDRRQLIFTPVRPGETTVVVRDEKGEVRLTLDLLVSPYNIERHAKELREALQDEKGIAITIVGMAVHVGGVAESLESLARVRQALADPQYKDTVVNLVVPSEKALAEGASAIEKALQRAEVQVAPFGKGSFILKGAVARKDDEARLLGAASKLARAQGFQAMSGADLVISGLTVGR